jgi:hypothetical protein
MAANAQLTVEMASIRCEQYLAMTPSQSRDLLVVDRRVVQLSDRQNHGGSSRTSEEYRECKSVIPDIVNDVLNLSR